MRDAQRTVVFFAILCTGFFLPTGFAPGRAAAGPSEVVIIGTVHAPTSNFTQSMLVEILKGVNPDLLLLEFDSSFFDNSFSLLEKYQDLTLESQSAIAVRKMTGVKLRPYDIEGRNNFYMETDYFNREMRLNQDISRLHASNQLAAEAKLLFEALLSWAQVRDAFGAERPEVINSLACDKAIEKKQIYAFKGIAQIIELTPALKDHKAFWSSADQFWLRRNEAMCKNIIQQAKDFAGKKIVVLCGYEHRYYLRQRLLEQAAIENLVVREYWQR